MTDAAIPTHNEIVAIVLPLAGDLPFLIASSSSHATIAAGTPANGPQQSSAAIAKIIAISARCDDCPAGWPGADEGGGGGCEPKLFSGEAQFSQNIASARFEIPQFGQFLFIIRSSASRERDALYF